MPTIDDFHALGLRVGRITRCEPNLGARDPAYKLWIDFGDGDDVQSSAKLTELYGPADLIGRHIVAVTGFPAIRVAGFRSDVLVLGVETPDGVRLLGVDGVVPPGAPVS